MTDYFDQADKLVSVHEGGYSNHPKDPGGATMKGVTQRTYDDYRRRKNRSIQDVRKMSEAERKDIYRTGFWDTVKADQLPPGVSYAVYDISVNSGPGRAAKILQASLGVKIDGVIGPATLAAAKAANASALIDEICDRRLAFMRELKGWPTFKRGWTRRVADVRAAAKDMVNGEPVSTIPVVAPAEPVAKAVIEDAKPAPTIAIADAATGGGLVTGGAMEALRQAQDQLMPLAASSDFIKSIIGYLAVAAVVMTVGGLAWRTYAKYREVRRAEALGLNA